MGLTLIAVLTAALLLPGIIATRFFYRAAQTHEVDAFLPPLSSLEGIVRIGVFSVLVHFVYATFLRIIAYVPPVVPIPAADPYRVFVAYAGGSVGISDPWAVFAGVLLLCLTATPIGFFAGRCMMRWGDRTTFYGPLARVISQGHGDDRVILAYVLSKIEDDRPGKAKRILGYQGAVTSLVRDDDRFPAKLILADAAVFYLEFGDDGSTRRETGQVIDWIALSASDWHNVAFKVFQIVDDESPSDTPAG